MEDLKYSYMVSSIGRVKRLPRLSGPSAVSHGRSPILAGEILKQSMRKGYYTVNLRTQNKKSSRQGVHRLMGLAFKKNPLNKETINHIDTIKTNNRLSNLEWATVKENTRHAYDNDLCFRGSSHKWSVLTEKDILKILKLSKSGLSGAEIARRHNVTKGAVYNILTGWTWNHITGINRRRA